MTREERDQLMRHFRAIRGDLCMRCAGAGTIMYPSTATWRKGMGGASMTPGVCDTCWGSGDVHAPWTDLRKLEAEEHERITNAASELLDVSLGVWFNSSKMKAAQRGLANVIEKASRMRKLPEGADTYTWHPLCSMLAKRLRQFADANEEQKP